MRIRPYAAEDRPGWEEYVSSHPEGTVFHTRSWQEAVAQTFGHSERSLVAVSSENGSERLVGILPLFLIKSFLFGKFLVSVPFAERGGPLADSEQVCLDLVQEAQRILRDHDLDYLEMRNKHPLPELPAKDLYFGFQREILPEIDDNLKAIPRKSRRMVRQGIKNNLQASTGNQLLPQFYSLLSRNFRMLGTPIFPYSWFENLVQAFGSQALVLMVQDQEGSYIAGVLTFFYGDKVLPYYAGSLLEARKLAPNDFMYWKLMELGWQWGYKVFDFGRSKKETGSYRFKTHWGFEPSPLSYQYVLHKKQDLPDINPSNPKFRTMIKLWSKMPLGLTQILGPRISKYLC